MNYILRDNIQEHLSFLDFNIRPINKTKLKIAVTKKCRLRLLWVDQNKYLILNIEQKWSNTNEKLHKLEHATANFETQCIGETQNKPYVRIHDNIERKQHIGLNKLIRYHRKYNKNSIHSYEYNLSKSSFWVVCRMLKAYYYAGFFKNHLSNPCYSTYLLIQL